MSSAEKKMPVAVLTKFMILVSVVMYGAYAVIVLALYQGPLVEPAVLVGEVAFVFFMLLAALMSVCVSYLTVFISYRTRHGWSVIGVIIAGGACIAATTWFTHDAVVDWLEGVFG